MGCRLIIASFVVRVANQGASVDAPIAFPFAFGGQGWRATEQRC